MLILPEPLPSEANADTPEPLPTEANADTTKTFHFTALQNGAQYCFSLNPCGIHIYY